MNTPIITAPQQLEELCSWLQGASDIALDTEFVSEDRYRPELCLLQVAARQAGGDPRLEIIDPLPLGEEIGRFWEVVAAPGHASPARSTVVHAGRQELIFCLESAGKAPAGLYDVQIAAGMVGLEYPASHSKLVGRLLDVTLAGGETRTNWRRRPLSARQLEYALDDVRYLLPMKDALDARLQKLNREDWLREEMDSWTAGIAESLGEDRWRRVSGCGRLAARELAIVRELFRWREEEAERRNQPSRRILRDDLIVELARRRSDDAKRIAAIRGFERRNLQKAIPQIAGRIGRALKLPKNQWPRPLPKQNGRNQHAVLGSFLASVLGGLCRQAQLSPQLLGGPNDVRDLLAYRLDEWTGEAPPALAVGWRAEVVGRLLDDVLQGKMVVRVADPAADQPLVVEPRGKPS